MGEPSTALLSAANDRRVTQALTALRHARRHLLLADAHKQVVHVQQAIDELDPDFAERLGERILKRDRTDKTKSADVRVPIRGRVKGWLIHEAHPDAEPESWPDGRNFFQGFLIGVPVAALLWVGIIKGLSWVLR